MQATTPTDRAWHRLLQPLLTVKHPHLQPLEVVSLSPDGIRLRYGQSGPCPPLCTGLWGAVRAVHGAGLWVGDVLSSLGLDTVGRCALLGVGSGWVLTDPFDGHPAASGDGLRIGWRQRADLHLLATLDQDTTDCSG